MHRMTVLFLIALVAKYAEKLRMTCAFSGHSVGTKSGQGAKNWDILASQVTRVFLGTSPQKPGCPRKSGMFGQFQHTLF